MFKTLLVIFLCLFTRIELVVPDGFVLTGATAESALEVNAIRIGFVSPTYSSSEYLSRISPNIVVRIDCVNKGEPGMRIVTKIQLRKKNVDEKDFFPLAKNNK